MLAHDPIRGGQMLGSAVSAFYRFVSMSPSWLLITRLITRPATTYDNLFISRVATCDQSVISGLPIFVAVAAAGVAGVVASCVATLAARLP